MLLEYMSSTVYEDHYEYHYPTESPQPDPVSMIYDFSILNQAALKMKQSYLWR